MLRGPTPKALIDLAYEAALDGSLWPRLLEGFGDALGGRGVALIDQNQIDSAATAAYARIDPLAHQLYVDYFAARNPYQSPKRWERRPRRINLTVLTGDEQIPTSQLVRTEFHNDFSSRFEMHQMLGMGLAVRGDNAVVLSTYRTDKDAPFGRHEIALGRKLQPHFIRAFRLSTRLQRERSISGVYSRILDGSNRCIFLLDDLGRVMAANKPAEVLTIAADGLKVERGRLSAITAHHTAKLEAVTLRAAQGREGGALLLPRRSGRAPYSLIAAPIRREIEWPFGQHPAAIVSVTDPESGMRIPGAVLRDLYGMTPAEARVAAEVLTGLEPKAIAEKLRLKLTTVRVHIMHIMAKTETKRHSELVRLLTQLAAALPG